MSVHTSPSSFPALLEISFSLSLPASINPRTVDLIPPLPEVAADAAACSAAPRHACPPAADADADIILSLSLSLSLSPKRLVVGTRRSPRLLFEIPSRLLGSD